MKEKNPSFPEVLRQKAKGRYKGLESKMAKAPTTWEDKKEHKDKHQGLKPGHNPVPVKPIKPIDKIGRIEKI